MFSVETVQGINIGNVIAYVILLVNSAAGANVAMRAVKKINPFLQHQDGKLRFILAFISILGALATKAMTGELASADLQTFLSGLLDAGVIFLGAHSMHKATKEPEAEEAEPVQ